MNDLCDLLYAVQTSIVEGLTQKFNQNAKSVFIVNNIKYMVLCHATGNDIVCLLYFWETGYHKRTVRFRIDYINLDETVQSIINYINSR